MERVSRAGSSRGGDETHGMSWRRHVEIAALLVLAVVLAGFACIWALRAADTVAAWTLPTRAVDGGETPQQPFEAVQFRLEVVFNALGVLMVPLGGALLAALWPSSHRRAMVMVGALDAWFALRFFDDRWLQAHWTPTLSVATTATQTLALAVFAAAMAWRARRPAKLAVAALACLALSLMESVWTMAGWPGPWRPTSQLTIVSLQVGVFALHAAAWALMTTALLLAAWPLLREPQAKHLTEPSLWNSS